MPAEFLIDRLDLVTFLVMGFFALLRFLATLLRLLLRDFRIGIHLAEPFCEIVDLLIVVLNVGD